ncbi:hypothetical protein EDB85DRAFT_1889250 [Lactarius pseudohatsudake]|nr:hypothetical protein EDB85DRAFT_1889250 [Lactarius pseudohatsudake]
MAPIIFWNGLYCAKRKQWNLVERRIWVHFGRKKLWELNVKFAVLRPMGWHGESGSANWGGHVTVDFHMQAHIHVSTHHVYCTEAAYGGVPLFVSENLDSGNPISPVSCYHRHCDWGRTACVWQSALAVAEASSLVQQAPQMAKKLSSMRLCKRANPQAYKLLPLEREAKAQLTQHEPTFSNMRLRHSPHGSAIELFEYESRSGEFLRVLVLMSTHTDEYKWLFGNF